MSQTSLSKQNLSCCRRVDLSSLSSNRKKRRISWKRFRGIVDENSARPYRSDHRAGSGSLRAQRTPRAIRRARNATNSLSSSAKSLPVCRFASFLVQSMMVAIIPLSIKEKNMSASSSGFFMCRGRPCACVRTLAALALPCGELSVTHFLPSFPANYFLLRKSCLPRDAERTLLGGGSSTTTSSGSSSESAVSTDSSNAAASLCC